MASNTKLIGAGLALGRIAIGVGLWVAPEQTARALGVDRIDARSLMLGRLAATRDLVLGVWQLASLDDPAALRRVSTAAAVVDAGDTLTFALAAAGGEERQAGLRGVAVALPATLTGAWLASQA
jgi:hypothetical protein